MIIESVTLENFRQFKDKHQITFSTDDAVNVTVVMGENGSGKTTALIFKIMYDIVTGEAVTLKSINDGSL